MGNVVPEEAWDLAGQREVVQAGTGGQHEVGGNLDLTRRVENWEGKRQQRNM